MTIDIDPKAAEQMIAGLLKPWDEAVDNPEKAQTEVLHRLLRDYGQTSYGNRHGANQISTFHDYRQAFPIATYEDFKPIIEKVMAGDISELLCEQPVG